MIRNLSILALFCLSATAQPNAFTRVDIYPTGPTPGYLRLFEVRANGNNHVAIQAADSIASDCTYRISETAFLPCFGNQIDLGASSQRFKKLWSQDADVGALTVGGLAGFAGNISFSGTATPLFSGLGSLGTASLPYGTVNGLNVVAQSTFRLGSSATAGRVLTTDSSGFGTWQPAPGGITSINGFTNSAQSISIGTAGSAPNISSSGGVHTVNIPQATQFVEGVVTTTTQTFGGAKTFSGAATFNSNISVGGTATITGNMSAANGTFSSIVNPGNYSPGFDGIGSVGLSGTRVGDVFSYRGNFASTLQASGLATLSGGLNVTGTSTFSGSIQFDADLLRNIGSSGNRANDVFMNRSRAVTYFYNGTVGLSGTVTAGTCILTFTSGGLTSTAGTC
jgi:hypothetical protein